MANAHLGLGDTTNAITMLARIAADPSPSQTKLDSIDAVGRSALGESAWKMLREDTGPLRQLSKTHGPRAVLQAFVLMGSTSSRAYTTLGPIAEHGLALLERYGVPVRVDE